jgi:hypothetical protein
MAVASPRGFFHPLSACRSGRMISEADAIPLIAESWAFPKESYLPPTASSAQGHGSWGGKSKTHASLGRSAVRATGGCEGGRAAMGLAPGARRERAE